MSRKATYRIPVKKTTAASSPVPPVPPGPTTPVKKAAALFQPPAEATIEHAVETVVDETPLSPEEVSSGFQALSTEHYREIVHLQLSAIHIDHRYQRAENQGEINQIADKFIPAALGTPVAAARMDPETHEVTYWLLDGQQRRAAAGLVGYTELVPIDVHHNLTLAEEAELFLLLNARRDVTAADKFKSALVAEEAEALAIKAVLDDLGIKLNHPQGFSGVAKARAIARRKRGLEQFRWALATLQEAFFNKPDCFDSRLVDGLATFHRHYEGRFKQTELIEKLQKVLGTPTEMVGGAQAFRKTYHVRMATAVANTVVRSYNYHRSKNKLPYIGINGGEQLDED